MAAAGTTRPIATPFSNKVIISATRAVEATLLRRGTEAKLDDVIQGYDYFRQCSPMQSVRVTDAIEAALAALGTITAAKSTEFGSGFPIDIVRKAHEALDEVREYRAEIRKLNLRGRYIRELVGQGLPLTLARDGGWRTRFVWMCSDIGLGPVDIARAEALAIVARDPLLAERDDTAIYFEDSELASNRWKMVLTRFRRTARGGT